MRRAAVEHVDVVGLRSLSERADAGTDQATRRTVDLPRQHFARDRKDLGGKLRRRLDRLRAGALTEIRGLQLQGDGEAGEFAGLQPRRDFFGQPPKYLLQRREILDVALERGLVGNG